MKSVILLFFIAIGAIAVAQDDELLTFFSNGNYSKADSLLNVELRGEVMQGRQEQLLACKSYVLAEMHDVKKAQLLLDSIKKNDFLQETGCLFAADALVHYRSKSYWESYRYAELAVAFYKKKKNWERAARFVLLKALNMRLLSQFAKSEALFDEAAGYYQKINNKIGAVVVERYKGRLLTIWSKEKRQGAKLILLKSARQLKQLGAFDELAYAYVCLVDAHILDNELEQANNYQILAYDLAKRLNDANLLGLAYTNFGEIQLARGEYIAARKSFLQAMETYPSENRNRILWAAFHKLIVEYKLGVQEKTTDNLFSILEESEKLGDVFLQRKILKWLTEEPPIAIPSDSLMIYLRKLLDVNDKIYTTENAQLMSKHAATHKLQALKDSIAVEEDLRFTRKKNTLFFIIGIVFISGVLLLWLGRSSMVHKLKMSGLERENLEQKKNMLEQRQETIHAEQLRLAAENALVFEREQIAISQNRRINEIIQAKKQERHQIARRLHDETSMDVYLVRQLLNTVKLSDTNGKKTLLEVGEMLQNIQTRIQRITYEISPEKFNELALERHFLNIFSARERTNKIKHILFVDETAEMYLYSAPFLKNTLYEVILTAVNNIVKHAKATELSVTIFYLDSIFVTIEDNGCGFELEKVKSGLGLQIMKGSAEYFEGKFEIDSTIGQGTVISITIPQVKLLEHSN